MWARVTRCQTERLHGHKDYGPLGTLHSHFPLPFFFLVFPAATAVAANLVCAFSSSDRVGWLFQKLILSVRIEAEHIDTDL